MLARVAPKNLQRTTGEPVKREGDLGEDIEDYCRGKGWLCGSAQTHKKSTYTTGWPDKTIIASGGRTFLLELKSKNGKASTKQLGTIELAKKLGHVAAIIDSYEHFLNIINGD